MSEFTLSTLGFEPVKKGLEDPGFKADTVESLLRDLANLGYRRNKSGVWVYALSDTVTPGRQFNTQMIHQKMVKSQVIPKMRDLPAMPVKNVAAYNAGFQRGWNEAVAAAQENLTLLLRDRK